MIVVEWEGGQRLCTRDARAPRTFRTRELAMYHLLKGLHEYLTRY